MLTVTMQLNVGSNEAGDWANRTAAGEAATATRPDAGPHAAIVSGPHDELLIRLHNLRGAMDAMRAEAHGVTLAETSTAHAEIAFGAPAMYHGLSFVMPSFD